MSNRLGFPLCVKGAPSCFLILLVSSLVAGCSDEIPTRPAGIKETPQVSSDRTSRSTPNGRRTVDHALIELATEIPTLGGVYFDNGVPTVLLTDRSKAGQARGVLSIRKPFRSWDLSRLQVGQAEFRLLDLARWRDVLRPILARTPEVVSLDLDEKGNRVVVGLSSGDTRSQVIDAAIALGIPERAVRTRVIQGFTPLQGTLTLRDRVRPVVGGLEIEWRGPTVIGGPDRAGACTMGYVTRAKFPDHSAVLPGRFMITASHCSGRPFELEASDYFQESLGEPLERIGAEYSDPQPYVEWQSLSCPYANEGARCRLSEATLVKLVDSTQAFAGLDRIARTRFACTGCQGSITIDTVPNDYFSVLPQHLWGDWYWPFVGERSDLMGAVVGWSSGEITATCFDRKYPRTGQVYEPPYDVWLLCQFETSAVVEPGDSGSPVFRPAGFRNTDGREHFYFHGIAWGGINLIGGTPEGPTTFSMWEQIDAELHALACMGYDPDECG
jgi:hypothetical protein